MEMVKLFSATGHKIVALSRNIQPVQALALDHVLAISCDLTKETSLQEVQEFVQSNWGKVDVLINNAGAIINKPFKETGLDAFKRIYDTNVFGVVGLTQKCFL